MAALFNTSAAQAHSSSWQLFSCFHLRQPGGWALDHAGFWTPSSLLCFVPQEVSILKSLNYDKNIVQFYGACMRPGQDLMLVTEVSAPCRHS